MYTLRRILKAVIYFIVFLWFIFFGIIIYAVITDYRPENIVRLVTNDSTAVLDKNTFTLLTWNIGYCGLGKDMDFIYEGGSRIITAREDFDKNFMAISDFLVMNDSIDFIFLQEVDRKSKRSYRIDQLSGLEALLKPVSSQYAVNYDVFFVPVPPESPIGKVLSGISIMGGSVPASSVRYTYPGKYGFPKQLFMYDRCFLVNRYKLANGKELVILNTQNESLDPEEMREVQLEYLKRFLVNEYSIGNYVIAGGDWNLAPPDLIPEFRHNEVNTSQLSLEPGFIPPGWTCVYDNDVPSSRTLASPYNPEVTATSVTDFFLISPNIDYLAVKCVDLKFRNSDHNPVILTAKLKY